MQYAVVPLFVVQFQPGPGSKAVTVSRLKSWYSQWNQVVLTAEPVVAEPMEAPVPLVAVSTTRVSPLVQSVDSASKLRVRPVHARCCWQLIGIIGVES